MNIQDGYCVMSNTKGQSTLVNKQYNDNNFAVLPSFQTNRIRLAIEVMIRLTFPIFYGIARGWKGVLSIRIWSVLNNVRQSPQMISNLLAIVVNNISINLSTEQVVSKFRISVSPSIKYIEEVPEKCVTLNILAEPPPGTPVKADIIFIHGLRGTLVRTWKQGCWNNEALRVHYKRPSKPSVRPPKRRRYSYPPNDYKYIPTDIIDCDSKENINNNKNSSSEYSNCNSHNDSETISEDHFRDIEYRFSQIKSVDENEDTMEFPCFVDEDINLNLDKYSKCWPGDWLPLDCPGVRVVALNYTSDPYLWQPIWIKKSNRTSLKERSHEMMDLLTEIGVGVGHPIVWVGHSKGGIFIKQMIVDAWESGKSILEPLWKSSRGILFYSVPHRGSPLANIDLPLLTRSVELMEIRQNYFS